MSGTAAGAESEDSAYDVAVIGYGPTGVTAANLLGARGLRVVVLERDAEIFTRARAISTDEEVVRIWQRIGLAERLKQDMLTERPVDFVDARGRTFVNAHPTSRGHGHPPQMFIYQPALEQVLRDGVDRYPNVDILLRHECLRLRQDADGVELTVVGTADDSVRRLRASYVIAADGGSSLTRAQLNIGYEGRTYEDRWVVIDTKMLKPWPDHDKLRFHCDPARPAVDCPTPLGHHRYEFPLLPGDDEEHLVTEDAVYRLISRYGIGRDSIEVLRATVYSHHVRFASRFRVGRVFLAGDAAHAMPPWIGQGMAAGVRDVANLCWKLESVLRGELPESVLDSYETERKPHVREVTKRAVLVGRLITERRRPVARFRDTALRALDRIPGFSDWMQDSNWIPVAHYAAGLQARPRTKATGHQIPQPWVTGPDGERVRLDDAFGGRWLLLRRGLPTAQPAWERLGVESLAVLPAGSRPAEGAVVDSDGILLPWLTGRGVATAALRPDAYVYAAAPAGAHLPPPPTGFAPVPRPATTTAQ
ncbi:3-(3-hydroxy-phenyl)propionate hydroxylase [Streptomyces sp. KhCrAH-43]|uniref:bifunctional 3-(3-hydroxy-phenyl)propionate/3-hydroxycinnamic acid hydroxylase n=1 Tax=unclassified Streptomyces TaxID=2593676 RepID=UPI00037AF784|nr:MULTISPECIES: bifunctional 3-(3-hydroxy-phenyl)propionate/3-hydroxycinnamic acid hydroxylase [unclassified Streptomyces]MYS32953.1 bifunctional 3-(3-hydroxy-phenyl)propionate/3-hydroxycinnamic acid hydroxylase [Streptomyces sp. SID4920]MYX67848.1 bifunctional 3-(3-hydroxy-phenyl)propionate/3-hydroxycinnamic acid hydroxylase [Streptomyces sp. SID8373]RAJ58257.1 3-(3-hydroxy-phenyl)propionate hydroxylase [Streptomyces sp. KhCrAH-43]